MEAKAVAVGTALTILTTAAGVYVVSALAHGVTDTQDCQLAATLWTSDDFPKSNTFQSPESQHLYFVKFAKVRRLCERGPMHEGKDFNASPKIMEGATHPDIIAQADREIEAASAAGKMKYEDAPPVR